MCAARRKKAPPSLAKTIERYGHAFRSVAEMPGKRSDYTKLLKAITGSMSHASAQDKALVIGMLRLIEPSPYKGRVPSQKQLDSEKYDDMRQHAKTAGHGKLTGKTFRELANEAIWHQSYKALEDLAAILKRRPTTQVLKMLSALLHSAVQHSTSPPLFQPDFVVDAPLGRDVSAAHKAIMLFDATLQNKNFSPFILNKEYLAGLRDLCAFDANHLKKYAVPFLTNPGVELTPPTLSLMSFTLKALSARP